MDRAAAIARLTEALRVELDTLERMTRMAVDEATNEQSRAENKYDTRGLEASYLARGQGERVVALRRVIGWLEAAPAAGTDRVGLGTLVRLDDGDGAARWVLIVPDLGGHRFEVDGAQVDSVTPASPLGQALVGCAEDDEIALGGRALTVAAIR